MSTRLRPMGKPCLRSPRGALLAVAGVVAFATAPATAAYADHVKQLGWYPEQGAVPATVQFADVATDGTTVLAAGRNVDATTAEETAVIYRRVGDAWQAETLPALAPPSAITDVAVHGAEEWAVGQAGGAALVLRNVAGAWTAQTQLPKPLTSLAVRGSRAFVGDEAGTIHIFDAAGVTTEKPFAAGAINDIALTGEGVGVAVASYREALPGPFPVFGQNSVRIYSLSPDAEPLPDYEASARAPGVHMETVAAAANGGAVATDGTNSTWHRTDDGHWVQDAVVSGAALEGIASLTLSGNNVREALVGSVGTDGAIWQRDRYKGWDAPWQVQTVAAGTKPLHGVALAGVESGFAVGADGTILRLWRPPDPERHDAEQAALLLQQQQQTQPQGEGTVVQEPGIVQESPAVEQPAAAEPAAAEPSAQTSSPPPPPPVEQDDIRMNGVVIDDSEPRSDPRPRLLKNVRAVRRGQRLIVSFRLTARARVALIAKRGRRVIARTPMRTLRKGRRRLVLRFRGRPPSSLKVVVRRVSGARDNR